MAPRSLRLGVVGLLLAFLSGCGGESELAEGCEPPAHEDELLAAYRADPVFAVRPPEALPNGDPQVEKGCVRLTGGMVGSAGSLGTTATKVSQFFALNVGFTQDELTALYDPDIRARGWAPEPLDLATETANGKQAGLYYCKELDGVPSFLSVIERYSGADVVPTPNPDAWPAAGTLEVGITAIRGIRCANAGA